MGPHSRAFPVPDLPKNSASQVPQVIGSEPSRPKFAEVASRLEPPLRRLKGLVIHAVQPNRLICNRNAAVCLLTGGGLSRLQASCEGRDQSRSWTTVMNPQSCTESASFQLRTLQGGACKLHM